MVSVRKSTIIDAPVDDVWRTLRDFNGHDRWHPAVAESEIEGGEPTDMIGAVRHFRLADGGELREQLLTLSDKDRTFSYCILEAPFPLMNYVATVRLKPVTDGERTFWEWSSNFDPPAHQRDELATLVGEAIYEQGFEAIRAMFGERAREVTVNVVSRAGSERSAPPPRPPEPSPVASATSAGERTGAIVVDRYGGPDELRMREIALPPPGPGEVRIRHHFVGVNFIDVYCRAGYFTLLEPPGVPGMEAAGVVEALGQGVTGLSVGDRIGYACPPVGAYCEARNMAPDLLVRLPDHVSDPIAAAGLLKGITASFLLHEVHPVRAGETLLIHAAAGGVGQLLVQWARRIGARVIATASTDEKAAIATARGADDVIVYSREDFSEAVGRLTDGRGADVIYDAVGKDTFARSLDALAIRGHLVSFGQASGPVGSWDIGDMASKSITVSRPNYGHYSGTTEDLTRHVERFFSAFRQGIVTIEEPTVYELENAAQAHRDLEARLTTGSIVLRV